MTTDILLYVSLYSMRLLFCICGYQCLCLSGCLFVCVSVLIFLWVFFCVFLPVTLSEGVSKSLMVYVYEW